MAPLGSCRFRQWGATMRMHADRPSPGPRALTLSDIRHSLMAECLPTLEEILGSLEMSLQVLNPPAIHAAAAAGNVEDLKALFAKGPIDVDARWIGYTALVLASLFGHPDCVSLLLGAGAHAEGGAEHEDDVVVAPAFCAALKNHTACLRLLLEVGASPGRGFGDGPAGHTPLSAAAETDSICALKILLDAGAAALEPLDRGHWPLMSACQHGSLRAVDVLLTAMPRSELRQDQNGATPLMLACIFDQPAVVQRLLRSGPSFSYRLWPRDAAGQSEMDHAVLASSRACIHELLVAGARLDLPRALQIVRSGEYVSKEGADDVRLWLGRLKDAHQTFTLWTTAHLLCVMPEAYTRAALQAPEGTLSLGLRDVKKGRILGPGGVPTLVEVPTPVELAKGFLSVPSPREKESTRQEARSAPTPEGSTDDEADSEEAEEASNGGVDLQAEAEQFAAASRLVSEAAAPWSPESHQLFPLEARRRAWSLAKLIHLLCADPAQQERWGRLPPELWLRMLGPHLIVRHDKLLSKGQAIRLAQQHGPTATVSSAQGHLRRQLALGSYEVPSD